MKPSKGIIKILKDLILLSFLVFTHWYAFCLPEKLFSNPTSTVLLDRKGVLLGAKIAEDGQWRFSATDSIPPKFEKCIIEFEDRTFYQHCGISINGIGRAIVQNFKNKRIVNLLWVGNFRWYRKANGFSCGW